MCTCYVRNNRSRPINSNFWCAFGLLWYIYRNFTEKASISWLSYWSSFEHLCTDSDDVISLESLSIVITLSIKFKVGGVSRKDPRMLYDSNVIAERIFVIQSTYFIYINKHDSFYRDILRVCTLIHDTAQFIWKAKRIPFSFLITVVLKFFS